MSQTVSLYNTLSRSHASFCVSENPALSLYTCGPTVYDYAHIGNFRTYVFEDLLKRTLQWVGFKVNHVMNLTDVDDKTIRGANKKRVTLDAFTQPFKEAFFADMSSLSIRPADHYPEATQFIPQMIEMIQSFLESGAAYQREDGSVYFSIQHSPDYGCLSHLNLDELKVGGSERVEADEYDKENVSDFVLWKGYNPVRDGKIFWESPFGRGRPGWHLECSAMALHFFKSPVDIHCGGVDNIFPHHENEIAQSETYTGETFATLWMHAQHLIVDGKKMSKSLGNFYTLRSLFERGYTGNQVRYLLLQTHYRTQLNFTLEGLNGAKHALDRLQDFIARMQQVDGTQGHIEGVLFEAKEAFQRALCNDLNISAALAVLFDLVRQCNGRADEEKISQAEGEKVLALLSELNRVLGVLHFDRAAPSIPQELQDAFTLRDIARREKNWKEADRLRDLIGAAGYVIEDTAGGTSRLKKK